MSQPTARETAAAARQVAAAMIQPTIQVSEQADRTMTDDHRSSVRLSRTARPAMALVSVEMVGPGERCAGHRKTIIEQGEAHAWCDDEIVGAATLRPPGRIGRRDRPAGRVR